MPRELKQETYEDIAAISAFIRRNAFIYGTDLADRLDAAWKRQMSQSWHHREMEELIAKHEKEVAELKKQTGNAAAMHAALRQIKQMGIELRNIIPHLDKNWEECLKASIRIYQTAEQALLEPPRNCDVGTAEEQQNRFNCFCKPCADGCPFLECRTIVECAIKWAQTPYAEEGGAK